ncbi:MAG: 3-keto-5-aminohexanoate cleavage protein [Aequorivita sp.]
MTNNKVVINFCPTGMIPTKELTPHVPVSPTEIIEQTHEAYELGITIAHLHARELNGTPTWRPEVYREIFEGVRKHCPHLVICGSTSGRDFPEFEKRSAVIDLKPDMCSLTLSSLNFVSQASVNSPDMIVRLVKRMQENGVIPEMECFDLGMINYGKYLINKGYIEGPFYWNLLFGNIAGFQNAFGQIGIALNEIPSDHFVGLAGLGAEQLPINSVAISMGYNVRVGIEDNIWWDRKRTRLATNIDLIERIHSLIEINGKEFFKPEDFGKLGFYNRK